jgi:hypothetical protein
VTRLAAFRAGLVACAALIALAFVAGPRSCDGGLTVYFFSGLGCFAAAIVAPFVLHRNLPASRRALTAAVLAGLVIVTWIAGFAMGGFRLLCRLF